MQTTQHGNTLVIVFDKGEEFIGGMKRLMQEADLAGAHFTAIGAFSGVTLAYFDKVTMSYHEIPVPEQVEVAALIGNLALGDDGPIVHAHAVVGKRDGSTLSGHVLEAHVWPTLEVMVTRHEAGLWREKDEETGLTLLNLDQ